MNPNSTNQRWSQWTYRVFPDGTKKPPYALVKENCARFGRTIFGAASEMKIEQAKDPRNGRLYWEIVTRSEGHPAHDPKFVQWMHAQWAQFLKHGFGEQSEILAVSSLIAGSRQDGTPADQWIALPKLESEGAVWPTSSMPVSKNRV